MPPLVLRALLEPLAEQLGLALVARQDAADVEHALDLIAAVASEGGDCVNALTRAVRDGHIDGTEGARLAREGAELERVGRSVRELGETAVRERVVAIAGRVPPNERVVPRRVGA
ncbi:hypothetical protein L6R52_42940 [Myxococcota bacterium]|nr:hypothetical protein [Myxococcota bacterium]